MKKLLQHRKGVIALFIALCFSMGTAYAYNFSATCPTGQTLYFNITDATNHYVEITYPRYYSNDNSFSYWYGYTKPTGNITLPSSVTYNGTNYSVTAVGNYAFFGCSGLTGSLTFPNTITTIGVNAFTSCSGFTGSLTLTNYVTGIGANAFNGCNFTGSLVIPNSMTSIGYYAFNGCAGFTSLIIPASVTAINDMAFAYCTGLTSMTVLPTTLPTISENLYGRPFLGVPTDIPVYVPCSSLAAYQSALGWSRFTNMLSLEEKLTYSINPDGVSVTVTGHLDGQAAIGEIIIPEAKTIDGVSYSVTAIDDFAFYHCSGLTGSLTIPNSVISIGNYAFCACSGFTSLTLGSSVTTIGDNAFYQCGFTGTLTLPDAVTTIGTAAFALCTGFTGSLTLPRSVTSIGGSAFDYCTGFTGTLTIRDNVTSIGESAFRNCSGFTMMRFGAINCADVTDEAKPFGGCGGTLIIVNGVQRIPAYMFYKCSGFTGNLTIPNTVTEIGNYAFFRCTGFSGLLTMAGNSLTTIGKYAFSECSGFTGSLTFPSSLTTIGENAYSYCSGFTGSLTIPNSVTKIYNNAFYHCTGLSGSLTLGNSVTWIGGGAFTNCPFTGSLTIPNSVTSIDSYAFYYCQGFTSLTIGNSVNSLGVSAFMDCVNLASITVFSETPPTVGFDGFYNVPNSIPVYVPCNSLEDYQEASGWSRFTNMQCITETLTVYDGTVTNNHIPAYIYYFDNFARSQFVMPADNLVEMTGSPITSMTFYTTSSYVPYTTVSPADVYLKEVSYTTISSYEPKASATTVYSGTFDIVSSGNGGEMTINFSTPYIYQGGNLLVGVDNTEDNDFKNIYFKGQTVSGASISGSNSSSSGDIPATQQNFIPKTTFVYTPYECSRPKDLTATAITTNSATLQWTGFQDNYDLRYRKRVYFFEDFENGLPEGWSTIDNNGDGNNWYSSTNYPPYCHSGNTVMVSASYDEDNDIGITPDNWLITPQLDLQGTMKVWLRALHPSWSQEHFAIYLSTTGNSVTDFTTILVQETETTSEYVAYTADLSDYAGQQGYIAIRHFNCTNMFALLLDDFGIFVDPNGTAEWETVYGIESGYTLSTLVSDTEYEWQVRGRGCDGDGTFTEWSRVHNFTTDMCEDMCAITITLTDAYSDGGGQIEVVDVATNNVLGTYTNSGASSTYTLNVCDGLELNFVYTSTDSWPYENGWLITDINEEVITEHEGCRISGACDAPTNGIIATYTVNCSEQHISLSGGDWHLIALPVPIIDPEDIPNMTVGEYDFYRFEPSATDEEWQNYKNRTFRLQSGEGYLYANGTDITLVFDGSSYSDTEPVEVPLFYDADDEHKCWNLVGNPFACEATLDRDCYVLNDEGTGIDPESLPAGTTIPPYTAVFVKAIGVDDMAVFTKVTP